MLRMGVDTCKYVIVLYCNTFSVHLTLTFAVPLIKSKKGWKGGGFKRSLLYQHCWKVDYHYNHCNHVGSLLTLFYCNGFFLTPEHLLIITKQIRFHISFSAIHSTAIVKQEV